MCNWHKVDPLKIVIMVDMYKQNTRHYCFLFSYWAQFLVWCLMISDVVGSLNACRNSPPYALHVGRLTLWSKAAPQHTSSQIDHMCCYGFNDWVEVPNSVFWPWIIPTHTYSFLLLHPGNKINMLVKTLEDVCAFRECEGLATKTVDGLFLGGEV